MAVREFHINHFKVNNACGIEWISSKYNIDELEPYVEYIQCDDGEDFHSLSYESKDFENVELTDFEAVNQGETYKLCFSSVISMDLEKHPRFKDALNKSDNQVVARINFLNDGKPIRDKDGNQEQLFEMDEDEFVELEAQ